jgi:hypothetical protein
MNIWTGIACDMWAQINLAYPKLMFTMDAAADEIMRWAPSVIVINMWGSLEEDNELPMHWTYSVEREHVDHPELRI